MKTKSKRRLLWLVGVAVVVILARVAIVTPGNLSDRSTEVDKCYKTMRKMVVERHKAVARLAIIVEGAQPKSAEPYVSFNDSTLLSPSQLSEMIIVQNNKAASVRPSIHTEGVLSPTRHRYAKRADVVLLRIDADIKGLLPKYKKVVDEYNSYIDSFPVNAVAWLLGYDKAEAVVLLNDKDAKHTFDEYHYQGRVSLKSPRGQVFEEK